MVSSYRSVIFKNPATNSTSIANYRQMGNTGYHDYIATG